MRAFRGNRWSIAIVVSLLLAFPASSAGQVLPPGGTFTDDDGSIHEANIEAIAAARITLGCSSDGTLYCPGDAVTRGQMASFIARALNLPSSSSDYFVDDDASTRETDINRLREAGITLGCSADGTRYCPDDSVTRAEMASLLARALDLPVAATDYFLDDTGNTHEANINRVAQADITLGCDASGTRYCPGDEVLRDQMASFLARAVGLDPIPPPPGLALALRQDGLGAAAFGTSQSAVTSVISSSLGQPTSDSGPVGLPFVCGSGVWGEADDCLGLVWDRRWYQETCWDQLCLFFGSVLNGSQPGELVLTGWRVQRDSNTSSFSRSPNITTPQGIGIGSSRRSIAAAYPNTVFGTSVGGIPTFDIGWTSWSGVWLAPGVMSFDEFVIHLAGGDGPDLAGF